MGVLRVLTYNIWFGEYELASRASALFDLLEERQADVIALQEVTPAFVQLLQRDERFAAYACSMANPDSFAPYANLILSRTAVLGFERIRLWSYQSRHLDLVRLVDGPVIGTVHLESRGYNAEIRATQIEDIVRELGAELWLLLGDFNFVPGAEEASKLPKHWGDAWSRLFPGKDGFTLDSQVNQMAAAQWSGAVKQKRIDRIYFDESRLRPLDIEVVGRDAYASDPPTWISDHFGLCAGFADTR